MHLNVPSLQNRTYFIGLIKCESNFILSASLFHTFLYVGVYCSLISDIHTLEREREREREKERERERVFKFRTSLSGFFLSRA